MPADSSDAGLLDAKLLDVEILDEHLLDLLWRPLLFTVPTSSTTNPSPYGTVYSWPQRILSTMVTREERTTLLQLITLWAAGTTPAASLLRLEWRWPVKDELLSQSSSHRLPLLRLWLSLVSPFASCSLVSSPVALYSVIRILGLVFRRYQCSVRQKLHQDRILQLQRDRAQQEQRRHRNARDQQQQPPRTAQADLLATERQEQLCRVIHKIVSLCRLAAWWGWALLPPSSSYRNGDAGSWRDGSYPPNLAMVLSGARLAKKSMERASYPAGDHRPKLHVNYAHRRWLSREVLLALQLLYAGVLSSSLLREAWYPLVRVLLRSFQDVASAFRHLVMAPVRSTRELLLSRSSARESTSRQGTDKMRQPSSARQTSTSKKSANGTSATCPRCPVCGTDRIRIPFRAEFCGHVYCYTCLYDRSVVARHSSDDDPRQEQRRTSSSSFDGDACLPQPRPPLRRHHHQIRCLVCRNPIARAFPMQ